MSSALRPIYTNSTGETNALLEDQVLRAEILWTFIILLHFAALIPLNPILVHICAIILNWVLEKAKPVLEQQFYNSLADRLYLDSSIGVRSL